MKIELDLRKLGHRLDEAGLMFFEGRRFVHAPGCKNIRLKRETVRVDNNKKNRTTRSCEGCEKSDVVENYVVDKIF